MRCCAAFFASTLVAVPAAFPQAQTPAVPMELMPAPERPLTFQPRVPTGAELPEVGQEWAYSFCTGSVVALPPPGGRKGTTEPALDPALSPCGSFRNRSPYVSGGNPPYHFQVGSGTFPPLGMILDLNGVLRGKPVGHIVRPFDVCVVDSGGQDACREVTIEPRPAVQQQGRKSGGGAGAAMLIAGLAGAGAAAAVAGASLASAQAQEDTRKKCAPGTDCGDGGCCSPGSGCCGLVNGVEACCPTGFVHYCRSDSKCYQYLPNCDSVVCHGVVGSAPGILVGGTPYPTGVLLKGDPRSTAVGVPAVAGCRAK